MSVSSPSTGDVTGTPDRDAAAARESDVVADRGIASVNRSRSVQSRMSNLMALGLMGALGLGLLSWYYSQAWAHQKAGKEIAQKSVKASAEGDLPLPPLGRIDAPIGGAAPSPADPAAASLTTQSPPAPSVAYVQQTPSASGGVRVRVLDRQLDGPVFASVGGDLAGGQAALGSSYPNSAAPMGESSGPSQGEAANTLRPTVATAVRATVLANLQLVLPRGAFIDCTLETAIDSALPGLTTCVTATDTFGADGKVVLLERGTKLVGETKGDVRQGTARVFVLWTEARTPSGVVVPLASPGTDELGRSGLPGAVDRHFMDRFGAAVLISMIDGAVQAASQPKGGGAVIYNPSASTDVVTEVLKSTVNIPPTVRKRNGDRIQILVARDLDFASVYALRVHE